MELMEQIQEFDLWMQQVMSDIGFYLYEKGETSVGYIDEWKFYDPHLIDKHWTMVVFRNKSFTQRPLGNLYKPYARPVSTRYCKDVDYGNLYRNVDYRLYIHWNDGRYNSSSFQIGIHSDSNRNYVREKMESLFVDYFRDKKLGELLRECGSSN